MGRFSKGFMATATAVITTGLEISHTFCDTWLPAVVVFLGAVGVVWVPNARVSDDQRK